VNDVPLGYQHSVPLHSGDRIELGMLHLEVIAIDRQSFAQRGGVSGVNPAAVNAGTLPAAVPATNFSADDIAASLTSLIRGKHIPHKPGPDQFDIVSKIFLTDSGAANPTRSAAFLLSDQDIIDGKHLDPAYIAQVKSNAAASDVPAIFTSAFSPDTPGGETSRRSDDDAGIRSAGRNILDELAKDYILAIQDPASLHAQRSMHALPELSNAPLSTPTELIVASPRHVSIEDMVSGRLEFDDMLPLISGVVWQLPSSMPNQDVLHLFADGIAIPAQRAKLPSVTRREHHAFSPDSSYSAASELQKDQQSKQQVSKNSTNSAAI